MRTCVCTQSPALIVHPRTAVRGPNGRDNRGPGRDNGGPPDAIIGVTLDAIMGPSQNYCKIHTDLSTIKSQSGHHVPRYGRNQAAMCPHMGPTLSPPTPSPTHPPPWIACCGQLEIIAPGPGPEHSRPRARSPQARALGLDVFSLRFTCFCNPTR